MATHIKEPRSHNGSQIKLHAQKQDKPLTPYNSCLPNIALYQSEIKNTKQMALVVTIIQEAKKRSQVKNQSIEDLKEEQEEII